MPEKIAGKMNSSEAFRLAKIVIVTVGVIGGIAIITIGAYGIVRTWRYEDATTIVKAAVEAAA